MDAALQELYASSYARLVRVLTVAAGSRAEAEEVVQDAFVRLIPRWSSVRTYDDPEAWLRKVSFRLLSNRRRARRVAARVLVRTPPPPSADGPTGDAVDVVRALARLPAAQRHVVVLHHLLGLPVEQVAVDLGLPVGP